jgi:hypothetical protein
MVATYKLACPQLMLKSRLTRSECQHRSGGIWQVEKEFENHLEIKKRDRLVRDKYSPSTELVAEQYITYSVDSWVQDRIAEGLLQNIFPTFIPRGNYFTVSQAAQICNATSKQICA